MDIISLIGLTVPAEQQAIGNTMFKGQIMDMFTMSVRLVHSKSFLAWLIVSLFWWIPVWSQGTASPTSLQQPYFLSGTATQHTPRSYPVILYRSRENKTLEALRVIVRQADGIQSVCSSGDTIFALY